MEISRLLATASLYEPTDDNQLEERKQRGRGKLENRVALKTRKKRRQLSCKQLWEKNQRDADNSRILNLTLDVNDLRQQVHYCLVQKSLRETRLLIAREQFHGRSLQSVERFFELFKHGYPITFTATEQRFLSELLDENVAVGGGVKGQAAFYEQWRRYKLLFSVRRLKTFSAQIVMSDTRGCLIECSGVFEGYITAAALKKVFPNALEDEALADQVLHRRFICPTRTLISIDTNGRWIQYDAEADVFKAMSELVDFNLFQAAKIMENATIQEGSLLPSIDSSIEVKGFGDDVYDGDVQNPTTSKSSIEFILS